MIREKMRKYLVIMFLIVLGITCTITYQNVSAVADEIVSRTIEINNNTVNGLVLNSNDLFGYSVANIGDLNGDGTSDIAVGAIGVNNYQGVIHIMFMNSDGTVSDTIEINNNTLNGPDLNDYDFFGYSVANIGDLNGDGTSDIAVGATGDDGDNGDKLGAMHIMFMNSNGTVLNTIEINNNTTNGLDLNNLDNFGASIANMGDLNGDGVTDIAVGADGDDVGGVVDANIGTMHIMFMNSDGTVSSTIEINNDTTNGLDLNRNDNFGRSVANIGDLNNDGVTDIAVGAYGVDGYIVINATNTTNTTIRLEVGAIHIMFMNSDGTVSDTMEINSNTTNGPDIDAGDEFGLSVANIGDLNGDGTSDIAVGAWGDDAGGLNLGAIHIIFMNSDGTVSGTIEIDNNTLNGPVLNDLDSFGSSIANIGDLNNDGISDIAVGAVGDSGLGTIHIIFLNNSALFPIITDITSDGTTGTLKVGDTIAFTLTLDSPKDGATINGTYNSTPLFWNSTNNGTTYTAIYTISEGDADQTIPLQITNVTATTSMGSPSLPSDGNDIRSTIDANSPKFTSAQTITTLQIAIIVDQNVANNAVSPNDFTLGGVDGGSIGSIAYVTNNVIGLNIVGATISDTDSVTLSYNRTSGSLDEVSGNSLLNFAENVTNNLDTPPVITLNGANPQTIELGSGYTELGATTNDGSSVTINSDEFRDVVGTYSIYYDSTDATGNDAIQVIRTVEVIPPPASCTPPASGDWTISESCMINSSVTIQGNVLVRDSSVLSIPSGVVLDIDFASFSLTVQSGSGVLIKSGGTVT